MSLLDLGRVVRSVRHRVGEHPPFLGGYGLLAPSQNDLGQRWVQRNVVLGVFGLDVIDSPTHEAALNKELMLLKIEVVPLKRRDFAHAKTEALGDLNHRAIRLTQCRNDEFEFAYSERGWTLPALAATFHANQGNGVSLFGEEFPAGGALVHQVHHASDSRPHVVLHDGVAAGD
jgi:hypothetical protein